MTNRRLFLALAALFCLLTAQICWGKSPNQFDGTWNGLTGQGEDISFIVADGLITSVVFTGTVSGAGCTSTVITASTTSGPISNNSFSFSAGSTAPGATSFTFSGTFTTVTTANGSLMMTLHAIPGVPSCAGTATTNWNATLGTNGGTLGPPRNLMASVSDNTVTLNWDAPATTTSAMAIESTGIAQKYILTDVQRKPPLSSIRQETQFSDVLTPNTIIDEVEPNNSEAQAQVLMGDFPLVVNGNAQVTDVGQLGVDYGGGDTDDFEDLYLVTTTAPGLKINLDGFTSDCDIFLLDVPFTAFLGQSNEIGATTAEEIDLPSQPAGTYIIAVTIYDTNPIGGPTTPYNLTVTGQFDGGGPSNLQSYNIYRSPTPNAASTGSVIGNVNANTTTFSDMISTAIADDAKALSSNSVNQQTLYYQVTAVYDQGESNPSNEVSVQIAGVDLLPPRNLTASVSDNTVTLNWDAPATTGATSAKENTSFVQKYIFTDGQHKTLSSTSKHPRQLSQPVTVNTVIDEIEPNSRQDQAQVLMGDSPLVVNGNAEADDAGELVIDYGEGITDDLEDLYLVTTTGTGLNIKLDGNNSDCDIFLLEPGTLQILGSSISAGATTPEEIDQPGLQPGTYLIGVTIYDMDPQDGPTSPYVLTATGQFGGGSSNLQSYNIYRSTTPNAWNTGSVIGTAVAGTTTFTDMISTAIAADLKMLADNGINQQMFYYQVTAVYDQGESNPSNEVSVQVGGVSLPPPQNLTASLSDNTVTLDWDAPGTNVSTPASASADFVQEYVLREGKREQPSSPLRRESQLSDALTPNTIVDEVEPNNRLEQAQALVGASPLVVNGNAEVADVGNVSIDHGGGFLDDFEDLYVVTTTAPGLKINLDGFTSDCDVYLMVYPSYQQIASSWTTSPTAGEEIDEPALAAGTYIIALTIRDTNPHSATTPYVLTVTGQFDGSGSSNLQYYNIYRSTTPNARNTGSVIGTTVAGTTTFNDMINTAMAADIEIAASSRINQQMLYYQVTAVYDQGESGPSNEVSAQVGGVTLPPPQNLMAPSGLEGSVPLSWEAPVMAGTDSIEIFYDDGTAENSLKGNFSGAEFAVRFTPTSYPVNLIAFRFIASGDSTNDTYGVRVYSDPAASNSGPTGTPVFDRTVTVDSRGTIVANFPSLIAINSGDFYISLYFVPGSTKDFAVGRDTTSDALRSWLKDPGSGTFVPAATLGFPGNFVLRALVETAAPTGSTIASTGISTGETAVSITALNSVPTDFQIIERSLFTSNASFGNSAYLQSKTDLPRYITILSSTIKNSPLSPTATLQSFNIYRSTSSPVPVNEQNRIGNVDQATTSFNDTNVMGGTTYFYVVTAVYDEGESGPSNEASATPAGGPPADVTVTIPDVTAAPGSSAQVSVNISGNDVTQILAGSVTFNYNQSVINSPNVSAGGILSSLTPNTTTPGQVSFSFANTVTLSGPGTLAVVSFNVVGAAGSTSPLDLIEASFNEGSISASLVDGTLTVSSNVEITGTVSYFSDANKIWPGVTLTATGGISTQTGEDGTYNLEVNSGSTLTVTPSGQINETEKQQAISAFDAVPVLQYAANFAPQNITGGPLEGGRFMAADVTGNGQVSAFDAVPILQLAAGFTEQQRVPSQLGQVVFDPGSRQYTNVTTNQANQDYEGVIRGDVTGNFTPKTPDVAAISSIGERHFDASEVTSELKDKMMLRGGRIDEATKTLSVPVWIEATEGMLAMVIELEYESKNLEFVNTNKNSILKRFEIVSNDSEEGKLTIAMAGSKAVEQGELMELEFRFKDEQLRPSDLGKQIKINKAQINEKEAIEVITDLFGEGESEPALPTSFSLEQNYPNPFNPSTTINFQIPEKEGLEQIPTTLKIYDVRGRLVNTLMDERLMPGSYSVHWDGSDRNGEKMSSGVYFYTITSGEFQETKKLMILK